MTTTFRAPLLLLCCLGLAPLAHAGEWLVGVKTGPMLIDQTGVDAPTNVAFMAGYQIGVVLGDVGIEGELSSTIKDGEAQGQDVDLTSSGLFATFRSAGPLYLKAKGGMVRSKLTVGPLSETNTSEAYGIGIGLGLAVTQLELEYTVIDNDSDVAFLSLGIQF